MAARDPANERRNLPSEHDFDPWGGCLDAQCAWKNFGGLTLEEANRKFREQPECYQEDFMFMGAKAFAYYFPVVDSYLRETPTANEGDDRQAWILAHWIKQQFDGDGLPDVRALIPHALHLAKYVRANIGLFRSGSEDDRRVDSAWQELEDHLKTIAGQ